MKKLMLLCLFAIGIGLVASAQGPKKRVSPKDSVAITTKSGVDIKIVYGRPFLKGREITSIVPYGKVWRTGANEATVFEINQDVTIEGKSLPAGKYSLYTIPGETTTTLIFNKLWNQWGTNYDQSNDFLRVDVPMKKNPDSVEEFTISLQKSGVVNLKWSHWNIEFKVKKG
ncbi:Protein of unknown function [Arachidicoccus rhizosphaerae]|uniref:DUF2911 domain-containing protein n=1 Tax=Arachidicoccus rhizosphaerae TaxID=551991 RepID=A0A1H3W1T3_9BACT|nr:DUF2911 domain-containing protein [Arachidicoccus rhizosphaerae]SDZ81125.1 Protein of unknown function [Arachidicoccus rhizosphaerae]